MSKDNENKPTVSESSKSVADQLAELQLLELREIQARKLEEKNQLRLVREAGMKSVREGMEKKKQEQEQCPHRKPYGESAIAGQRMHSHKYKYICQYCQKEWTDNELPAPLRINAELVGGPSY